MRNAVALVVSCLLACPCAALIAAQAPAAQFDVVSIKRNRNLTGRGGIRTLPDGTFMMTNQPIASVVESASPTPVREVVGLPSWVGSERYDIIARPPAGVPRTRDTLAAMWLALFADRMQFVAHIEERERDTYALVVDREDRRLGAAMQRSELECREPTPPPRSDLTEAQARARCGYMMNGRSLIGGSITMEILASALSRDAGRLINDRTGLPGTYSLALHYSTRGDGGAAPSVDEPPDLFTALREQLGLRLLPQTSRVPVLVVDRIERPSED